MARRLAACSRVRLSRVGVHAGTGWLSSFFDKVTGQEFVGHEGRGHAVVLDDRSDTWSHDLVAYEDEVDRFHCTALRLVEDGPVRQVVQAESTFGASRLTERFILGAGAHPLEVSAQLDRHERQRVLKLRFPSLLDQATATFSGPYGRLQRAATGSEEVGQAWVDVSGCLPDGRQAGWALLNDGKYAFDVQGSDIGITAARSPVYAWHDPFKLVDGQEYRYLDQGRQEFTYAR